MTDETVHDLIVIGAGMAGMTAARHALASGLKVAILESQMFGGLILNVNELYGDVTGSGADLASSLMSEISDLGVEHMGAIATAVERDGEGLVVTSDAGRHKAAAVIVASGAAIKKLGIPGEAELEYKGVSHCADCDGPMFEGEDVLVVGGGDSALQSALVLAKFCAQVHLVHRGASFRAKPDLAERVAANGNIRVHWRTVADEVLGESGVEAVRVRCLEDGSRQEIPSKGFFAFIGLQPACEFMAAELARDETGALVTNSDLQTEMPGVFAAGAVRSGCGGMLSDAMADGERAARSVAATLSS